MAQVTADDVAAAHQHALDSMSPAQAAAMALELEARTMASFTAMGAEARRRVAFENTAALLNRTDLVLPPC